MKYTYTKEIDTSGNEFILRSDNACIPMDESNSDYHAYLAWKAEQA